MASAAAELEEEPMPLVWEAEGEVIRVVGDAGGRLVAAAIISRRRRLCGCFWKVQSMGREIAEAQRLTTEVQWAIGGFGLVVCQMVRPVI